MSPSPVASWLPPPRGPLTRSEVAVSLELLASGGGIAMRTPFEVGILSLVIGVAVA
jgi:hypothetical protein